MKRSCPKKIPISAYVSKILILTLQLLVIFSALFCLSKINLISSVINSGPITLAKLGIASIALSFTSKFSSLSKIFNSGNNLVMTESFPMYVTVFPRAVAAPALN